MIERLSDLPKIDYLVPTFTSEEHRCIVYREDVLRAWARAWLNVLTLPKDFSIESDDVGEQQVINDAVAVTRVELAAIKGWIEAYILEGEAQ